MYIAKIDKYILKNPCEIKIMLTSKAIFEFRKINDDKYNDCFTSKIFLIRSKFFIGKINLENLQQ